MLAQQGLFMPNRREAVQTKSIKPGIKILKARKNLKMSSIDIPLLINQNPFVKRRTALNLLKRLGKKQRLFKVNATMQLRPEVLSMIKNFQNSEIDLESGKEPIQVGFWKRLFSKMNNLKILTVKGRNTLEFLPYKHLKLNSIEELNISLSWTGVLANIEWFSALTSLKRLSLELSYSKDCITKKGHVKAFAKFWKRISKNKVFSDLILDFHFGTGHQDYSPLTTFLDYFNSRKQFSSFSIRLDLPEVKNQLVPLDELTKTLTKSQMFTLDFYNNSEKKPPRRNAREIFLYLQSGVHLNIETLFSKCKLLEEIILNTTTPSSLFPKSLPKPGNMKKLSLSFLTTDRNIMSPFLENTIQAISEMCSLEQLILNDVSLQAIKLDQMIRLFGVLTDKKLKNFELRLQVKTDAESERLLFNSLSTTLDRIETLEGLGIHVSQIGDENLLWYLLFPRLKSISITIKDAKDNLDRSLLFQKFSQIPNLEKLSLDILSMKGLNELDVFKGLPDWKNLRELSIRKIAGRSMCERITQDEYKAFIERRMKK